MSVEEKQNEDNGQTIQAYEFEAPNEGQAQDSHRGKPNSGLNRGVLSARAGAPWWHSQFNLMLCVFGLLGMATLLFVVLTPAPDSAQQRTLITTSGDSSVGESTVSADESAADAPFDEAARQQARTDSQDILSDLLSAKKALEQKGVQQWADDQFNAALDRAQAGDELYKVQNYAEAITEYKAAVSSLEQIEDLIPQEISRRVAAGIKAVKDGKAELARESFESALQLDGNHIPALQGLERVNTLNDVLALLSVAAQHEQEFANSDVLTDIENAVGSFEQALGIDGQSEAAKLGLERSVLQAQEKRYRMAMTDGFNALFTRRYASARSAFNRALEIKPDDVTAKSALRQSLASDTRSSLSSLLSAAQRFERQEQWASALSNYQTVLQRDRNQVSAKTGEIRAQARLDLDRAIKGVLADPLSLSKNTARQRAERVLKDAVGITRKGEVLKQQIAALQSTLKSVDTVVKVALNSDSLTQVSLKKEGTKRISLGKFEVKNLALTPGRYTLTGSRLGFRDVRTEIELMPGTQGIKAMTISCTDLIAEAG